MAMTIVSLSTAAPAYARDKNCSDFRTQAKAPRYFRRHHPRQDPSGLDANPDRMACEDNPCPCNHHKPNGFAADKLQSSKATHRYYYSGFISGHGSIKLTLKTTQHSAKISRVQISGLLLNCRGIRRTMTTGTSPGFSVRLRHGRFDQYGQEQRGGSINTHGHINPNGRHFTGTIRARGELYTNQAGWKAVATRSTAPGGRFCSSRSHVTGRGKFDFSEVRPRTAAWRCGRTEILMCLRKMGRSAPIGLRSQSGSW